MDYRRRFTISLLLTLPVLALSPMIQMFLGVGDSWGFKGDGYILAMLSSIVFFYGGIPFLKGLWQEISAKNPGMMTLIGVAITSAYLYSMATVFGVEGSDFFWELVTLIDIMLFGHWIEMKSVIGAGKALEELASLMPDTAHRMAVPLVVAVSTAIAAHNGLLIRDRTAFEEARNTQAIIFDKTGTLTKGEFGITDVLVFDNGYKEEEIVTYAASIEQHSEHPIAQGIVRDAKEKWNVDSFKAIPGKGAEGTVKGKNVKAASPGYLREHHMMLDDLRFAELSLQGKTVIFVLIDDKVAGAIALADIIRPESKEAIAKLKEMGIQCIMLTGDNRQVAEYVGKEIGLDEVIAEVLPNQKKDKIREVQDRGLIVAMTGDGVNDAPALAQANIGIAIGAGTDVAIQTADIILVKSNPLDVVAIIGLARATYGKMIENLVWATGYNAFAIPAAAGALAPWGIVLSPAVGAVFMSLSTVICAVNAKLLKLRS